MKVDGSGVLGRNARAVVAALAAGVLASCTATSGPGFDMAAPSFQGGMAAMMADVARSESQVAAPDSDDDLSAPTATDAAGGEAEEAPSEQIVLLPAAKPGADTASPQAAKPNEAAVVEETAAQAAVEIPPNKRGFLASFFSAPGRATPPAPAPAAAARPLIKQEPAKEPAALIELSAKKERLIEQASLGDALPGVRRTSLFEITHKSGIDDDSSVDLYEDEGVPVLLASAAGLARLAPNGLLKQRESVDVACLKPALVRLLKTVERHYGKRMIITSGYRSPSHNRRVRGATRSQHMYCAAADVQVPGVSKWELANFVRSMPRRGGVGTYCHTNSVHIDVGPERDWNWRCRRKS